MKYAEIFKLPCPCNACGRADGCRDKDGMVVFCTDASQGDFKCS